MCQISPSESTFSKSPQMKCAAPLSFSLEPEAQSAGVVKTTSSGVPAGAVVSPSSGAIHPLTFESIVSRWATANEVSADFLTSLPAR